MYTLHTALDTFAEREDGTTFRDNDVRQRLIEKGFENVTIGASREWMRCSPDDVKTAIAELQSGLRFGLDALPPVRKAIGNGEDTKTITLSCGKLTTGVTVKQWASILMLRNLKSPETYFQAAFRVQSPWSIANPEGDDPEAELVKKPICFVFDFAPTRALRQLSE